MWRKGSTAAPKRPSFCHSLYAQCDGVWNGACNGNDDMDKDAGAGVVEIALETKRIPLWISYRIYMISMSSVID